MQLLFSFCYVPPYDIAWRIREALPQAQHPSWTFSHNEFTTEKRTLSSAFHKKAGGFSWFFITPPPRFYFVHIMHTAPSFFVDFVCCFCKKQRAGSCPSCPRRHNLFLSAAAIFLFLREQRPKLLKEHRIQRAVTLFVRVNSVLTKQRFIIMPQQKRGAHIQQTASALHRHPLHHGVIIFMPAVQHFLAAQPPQYILRA